MSKASKTSEKSSKRRPALTPEARENQMINYAVALAEQQLIDGTASSQVITHFLKLGSEKYRKETEKLAEENKLLRAKTEALQSQKNVEKLYADAIDAMRSYSGFNNYDEVEEDED